LCESSIPFLIAVRNIGFGSFDYIGGNPMLDMLIATEHLIQLGHRRIAFLGGYPANYAFNERYAGFVSTMRKHALPVEENLILSGGSSKAFGRKTAAELLRAENPPTAFIGYNDLVAIGIMNAIHDTGQVPLLSCGSHSLRTRFSGRNTSATIKRAGTGSKVERSNSPLTIGVSSGSSTGGRAVDPLAQPVTRLHPFVSPAQTIQKLRMASQ